VYKWKSVKYTDPIASAIIITPSWLKVESAIIFFKSFSKFAPTPAIKRVRTEINKRLGLKKSHRIKDG
jgi:hypothetical protein